MIAVWQPRSCLTSASHVRCPFHLWFFVCCLSVIRGTKMAKMALPPREALLLFETLVEENSCLFDLQKLSIYSKRLICRWIEIMLLISPTIIMPQCFSFVRPFSAPYGVFGGFWNVWSLPSIFPGNWQMNMDRQTEKQICVVMNCVGNMPLSFQL